VIEKGSIAVNGISLTVNGVSSAGFDVNIVPVTSSQTTLTDLQVGGKVNIETDLIGKYVEKMVSSWGRQPEIKTAGNTIDFDFLKKHGFV
jgi:riboflavin synthase